MAVNWHPARPNCFTDRNWDPMRREDGFLSTLVQVGCVIRHPVPTKVLGPLGAPIHFPCPTVSAYLQRTLPEVTSQDESFMHVLNFPKQIHRCSLLENSMKFISNQLEIRSVGNFHDTLLWISSE